MAFLISYGIAFMLIPMVLGPFFSVDIGTISPEWQSTRDEIETTVQWLPNVAMMVGIFIFVIKVLMVASVKGRD